MHQPVAGDAPDVQQVVDQAGHVAGLAADDLQPVAGAARPAGAPAGCWRSGWPPAACAARGTAWPGSDPAAPPPAWASSDGALALGDVGGDAGQRVDRAAVVAQGEAGGQERALLAVEQRRRLLGLDGLAVSPAPAARRPGAGRPRPGATGRSRSCRPARRRHARAPPRTGARPAGSDRSGSLTQMKAGSVARMARICSSFWRSSVSAARASWMSTTWPTHSRTRLPVAGQRRRPGHEVAVAPRGLAPEAGLGLEGLASRRLASCQASRTPARSSGWMACSQPSPRCSSQPWPV